MVPPGVFASGRSVAASLNHRAGLWDDGAASSCPMLQHSGTSYESASFLAVCSWCGYT